MRKTTKHLSQDSQCPGRDLHWGFLECRVRITTWTISLYHSLKISALMLSFCIWEENAWTMRWTTALHTLEWLMLRSSHETMILHITYPSWWVTTVKILIQDCSNMHNRMQITCKSHPCSRHLGCQQWLSEQASELISEWKCGWNWGRMGGTFT